MVDWQATHQQWLAENCTWQAHDGDVNELDDLESRHSCTGSPGKPSRVAARVAGPLTPCVRCLLCLDDDSKRFTQVEGRALARTWRKEALFRQVRASGVLDALVGL